MSRAIAEALVDALEKLLVFVAKHAEYSNGPDKTLTRDEVARLTELDGRVEAFRIQIPGLRMLAPPETVKRSKCFGYTQINNIYLRPPQFAITPTREWFRRMASLVNAARTYAEQPNAAEIVPQVLTHKRKPRGVDRAKDARNKWIYDQCCKGIAYDVIAIKLKNKPVSWDRIESKQGIQQAAAAHAKRHGLPPIPRRQGL